MALSSNLIKLSFLPKQVVRRRIVNRFVKEDVSKFSTSLQPQVQENSKNPKHKTSEKAEENKMSLNPIHHADYFKVKNIVSVEDLFNARVHYGHKEASLHDSMRQYLFGSRLGYLIIDLNKTLDLLHQALNIAAHIAYRDGIILFVAQSPQNSRLIETTAKECKEFAHTRYWRQGLFTNSTMLYGAVTRLPDLCIVLNTLTSVLDQHRAVVESAKMAIPTIGVVDTNCNPNLITYPVPGNDDSPSAISLYCKVFKEAILRGKTERKRVLEKYSEQTKAA